MTSVPGRDTVAHIPTRGGATLSGRWFWPTGTPRGAVLIAPAMATPARFYSSLASWLAENGYTTLTFDYEGFGDSRVGPLREVSADLNQWMTDADDALSHLAAETDGLPLTWIGHSLGGQIMAFADHTRVSRAITIAVGSGYWKLLPPRIRRWTPLMLAVVAPVTTRVLGYYPGSRLGLGNDLPAPAMRQWCEWLADPDYVVGAMGAKDRFGGVRLPITALSFTDDELISPRGVDALHGWFVNGDVTRVNYAPDELGVSRLGHFGLFRSRNRELWPDLFLRHLPEA
ncbi:alpha/beta fold hydrolase [Spiractinospora alimapuensis]|uniref:alpha/beta hydrolase family protein n=1 Tax=Spiractinospora alimapuensis TaxID=2820884 RepID=UPI001F31E5C3|nr:alpha/beta fold hydrolase [Spiractinospora alimapuensis]QVQ53827.1 alpha/beta fold hydrolase [Spiractinospora alimapuensis]